MKTIALLSDTHGYWDPRFPSLLEGVDQIWHAGDIGTMEVAEQLSAIAPLMAVHGNVDGGDLRLMYPELLRFRVEEVEVMIKHIGGYPGHYDRSVYAKLLKDPPQLFVSGHSHILKVMYDKELNLLHLNPGAAGLQGWQQVRTMLRFVIDGREIRDLDIMELSSRA